MVRANRKPVSIRDVAQASGVSPTTVSLILNNGDQRISQATRERVLATIKRLGYRPNRLAQGLQTRRSHILAILVPQLDHTFADTYFGELISGIYDAASKLGYKILLEAASPEFVRHKRYLELFDRCFIDGMLFMGSDDHDVFVQDLAKKGSPLLLVNNCMDALDWVVCDYAAAGGQAADHLLSLGHRNMVMITGAREVATARQLKDAFAERLATHGIALDRKHLEDGLYTEEGGASAIQKLLKRCPETTAVLAGNDKMAIGAMQMLLAMGKRVPEEVSVVGCDDIHQAAYVVPALTTVRTPLYDMGQHACHRMVEMVTGQRSECRETLPVELVVRNSTAPAPTVG